MTITFLHNDKISPSPKGGGLKKKIDEKKTVLLKLNNGCPKLAK